MSPSVAHGMNSSRDTDASDRSDGLDVRAKSRLKTRTAVEAYLAATDEQREVARVMLTSSDGDYLFERNYTADCYLDGNGELVLVFQN